jgi:hypothetical protein
MVLLVSERLRSQLLPQVRCQVELKTIAWLI